MKDVTWIAELLVTIVAIVVARYVIPWVKKKMGEIENVELDFWLDFAVKAAEEKYKEVSEAGNLKYIYVENFLKERGFKLDSQSIGVLIDGKVRELFNWNDYRNKEE